MSKHHLLPDALLGTELSSWIRANSIEAFDDEVKNYFSPDDIADFEHESSIRGREMNRLNELLKSFTEAVKKGCEEDMVFEVPATKGVKLLDEQRRQNDDFIEKGYDTEEIRIYGLVDQDTATMEYFSENGIHFADRSRNLTPKEKQKFLSPSIARKLAVNE